MLVNESALRRRILAAFKQRRPHLPVDRVSSETARYYARKLAEWIDADVDAWTGSAKTFTPPSLYVERANADKPPARRRRQIARGNV
jgi:hypothetical protein